VLAANGKRSLFRMQVTKPLLRPTMAASLNDTCKARIFFHGSGLAGSTSLLASLSCKSMELSRRCGTGKITSPGRLPARVFDPRHVSRNTATRTVSSDHHGNVLGFPGGVLDVPVSSRLQIGTVSVNGHVIGLKKIALPHLREAQSLQTANVSYKARCCHCSAFAALAQIGWRGRRTASERTARPVRAGDCGGGRQRSDDLVDLICVCGPRSARRYLQRRSRHKRGWQAPTRPCCFKASAAHHIRDSIHRTSFGRSARCTRSATPMAPPLLFAAELLEIPPLRYLTRLAP
jgi:hypothetical protein